MSKVKKVSAASAYNAGVKVGKENHKPGGVIPIPEYCDTHELRMAFTSGCSEGMRQRSQGVQ